MIGPADDGLHSSSVQIPRTTVLPRHARWTAGFLAALTLAAAPAAAQEMIPLPPGHWSLEAVRRAEAMGLANEYLPAQRTASRQEVGRALTRAADRADSVAPGFAAVARGWVARFGEEFPEVRGRRLPGGSAVGEWAERRGLAQPGQGYTATQGRPPRGAEAIEDLSAPRAEVNVAVRPAAGIALHARGRADPEGAVLPAWGVSAATAAFAVEAGRGATAYGSGGVTLSGAGVMDRVQLQTQRPIRLPAGLGRVALHGQAGVLRGERHPGEPLFVSAAISWRPHARLTLGGYRATIMGGDSADAPLTARTLFQTLLGLTQHDQNGFANQVASLEMRYRLPTEAVLPVTVYTEWAMEDLDVVRSVRDAPGGMAGIALPAVPGLPWLSLGAERISFSRSCCGNGIWYRHFSHHGGWAVGEQPLGHRLGGHGTETALLGGAELDESRLRLRLRAARRNRGEENLYSPERAGRSRTLDGAAEWRIGRRLEIRTRASWEQGDGWSTRSLGSGVSLLF